MKKSIHAIVNTTSLQTCRAQEDMVAGSAFQLGVLMPLDTASFQLPSGYGIFNLPSDVVMSPSLEVFKSRLAGAMVMQRTD